MPSPVVRWLDYFDDVHRPLADEKGRLRFLDNDLFAGFASCRWRAIGSRADYRPSGSKPEPEPATRTTFHELMVPRVRGCP